MAQKAAGFIDFLLRKQSPGFITTASPDVLAEAIKNKASYFNVDSGRVTNLYPERERV